MGLAFNHPALGKQVFQGGGGLRARAYVWGAVSGDQGLLQLGKNNDPRPGLQQALHLDLDLLPQRRLPVVDYHHGPVGQVAHTLALIFAIAHQAQAERLSRQKDNPQ